MDWIWNYLVEPFTTILSYNKFPFDYLQVYYGFLIVALILAINRVWGSLFIPPTAANAVVLSAIIWGGCILF